MVEQKKIDRLFLTRIIIIILLLCVALLGRYFAPHDPYLTSLSSALQPPSWEYPFGTDHLGRCILSRVLYGAPISIFSAIAVVFASTILGTFLGAISGYLGGVAEKFISQIVITFQAFPSFLLAVSVAGVLGSGIRNGILALILVSWTSYARFSKSLVNRVKHENYLHVARLHGAKTHHIVVKYIFPNIISPIIVTSVQEIGTIILSMSALSFLGLGAAAPMPELGAMMSEARKHLQLAPWYLIFPGLILLISVICFNSFGDALRKKTEL